MVSSDEARKELARRELARRRGEQAALPPGGGEVSAPVSVAKTPKDKTYGHFIESREPGMIERAGNWLRDNGILPIDQMRRELQTADDAARSFANKATFNQADRLAARMQGVPPEQEWEKSEFAEQRSPGASDLAGIAGAVSTPLLAGKMGLTLMRPGLAAAEGAMPAMARALLMGAEGGAYGSAQALGEGEDPLTGLLMGAGFGAGGQMLGETAGKVASVLGGKDAVRSIGELREAKNAAYKRVKDSGITYDPQSFKDAVADMFQTAKEGRLNPRIAPDAYEKLRDFGKLVDSGRAPDIKDLDDLRQEIWRDVGSSQKEAERHWGRMMIDKIDSLIENGKVIGGSGEDANAIMREARELNRRYKNSERFYEAMTLAERQTAASDSGGNLENTQRKKANQILSNPRKSKFLNAEEMAAMDRMIRGTPVQNVSRKIGKTIHSIPGGVGMLSVASGGAIPIAALLAGSGFKAGSRALGESNKKMVEALIREGKAPMKSGLTPEQIQMLSRMLLAGGSGAAAGS